MITAGRIVMLDPLEVKLALEAAGTRQIIARGNGHRNAHGLDADYADGLQLDIHGAAGELAAAKGLQLYWSGAIAQDVAGYQIRTTEHENGRLIIRPRDIEKYRPETIFALVVGKIPVFRLAGCIRLEKAPQIGRWYAPAGRPAALLVEQSQLDPIEEIDQLEAWRRGATQ